MVKSSPEHEGKAWDLTFQGDFQLCGEQKTKHKVESPVNVGEFKPGFSVVQFSLAMLNGGILS